MNSGVLTQTVNDIRVFPVGGNLGADAPVGRDPHGHALRNQFGCSTALQTHRRRLRLVCSDRDDNYRRRLV